MSIVCCLQSKVGRLLGKSLEIQDFAAAAVPHGVSMMACPIAVLSCPSARGVLRVRAAVSGAWLLLAPTICVSLQACHGRRYRVAGKMKHSGTDSVHKQALTHAREALSQQLCNDLIDQFLCLFRVQRRAKLFKPEARGRYK